MDIINYNSYAMFKNKTIDCTYCYIGAIYNN